MSYKEMKDEEKGFVNARRKLMEKYKVVCVDMFQTLVDVNSRRHEVFKRILGETYEKALAEEYWEDANRILSSCLEKYVMQSSSFYTIKQIFEKCYEELFIERNIMLSPKEGAAILADEHGLADTYSDAGAFFDVVGRKYPICLVSDTDFSMVKPLLDRFKFDKSFLSEEIKCYKHSPQKNVFEDVLAHYQVEPCEIIHIGDSFADVAGAKRYGITTCWLNRNDRAWKYDIKPDYTAGSLIEAAKIIEIKSESKL